MLPESGVTKMPGASRGEVIGSENFLGSKIQIAGGCMREMSLVEVVVGGSEVVTRRLEMRFEEELAESSDRCFAPLTLF